MSFFLKMARKKVFKAIQSKFKKNWIYFFLKKAVFYLRANHNEMILQVTKIIVSAMQVLRILYKLKINLQVVMEL